MLGRSASLSILLPFPSQTNFLATQHTTISFENLIIYPIHYSNLIKQQNWQTSKTSVFYPWSTSTRKLSSQDPITASHANTQFITMWKQTTKSLELRYQTLQVLHISATSNSSLLWTCTNNADVQEHLKINSMQEDLITLNILSAVDIVILT